MIKLMLLQPLTARMEPLDLPISVMVPDFETFVKQAEEEIKRVRNAQGLTPVCTSQEEIQRGSMDAK